MANESKSIRLDAPTYQSLYGFLYKGETFTEGVRRLLRIATGVANTYRIGGLDGFISSKTIIEGAKDEEIL